MGKTTEETNRRAKEVKNSSYKAFSLLMALLLLFSVSVPVFAGQDSSGAPPGSQVEVGITDFQADYAIDYEEITISENRRKYIELLEGGYSNHQLRQRFRELFGDGFSGEYIFHNYRTIFDLNDDEIIDSAFLRVLSGYRIDFRFQNVEDDALMNARGLVSDDGKVRIFPDSDVSYSRDIQEFAEQEFDESFLAVAFEDKLVPETVYNDGGFDWQIYGNAQMPEALSSNMVNVSLVSRGNTSITVDLWFANNTTANNNVQILDPAIGGWRWITMNHARTGRITISGLSPGVSYVIAAGTWDATRQAWFWDDVFVTTTLPPQDLIPFQRSSVDFMLDRTFTNALGITLTNNFLDATNQAFYSIRTLVGGPQFHSGWRMQLHHTRTLPRYLEGRSGWPMLWQLTNVHGVVFASLDQAQRMRHTNVETTEIPIHEIGHNFDNWRWSFETEAIAVLFTYYYYATTGRRMATLRQSRIFTGNEFRTYMRSYAYRALGQINHQEAMRRGVYSSYSMAYVLGTIAGQIGWQAFTNTFIRFHNMQLWEVPETNIDKLNVFLTFLRDYSGGRDVIGMIPNNARTIYERFFDGQIRYIEAPTATTITAPTHEQEIPRQNFTAAWTSVSQAIYVVSLRNLNTDQLLIEHRVVRTTNTIINQNLLTAGHRYRLAVGTVRGGRTVWSIRYFRVETQQFTVTLNRNGGVGGTGSFTARQNSAVTTPATLVMPTRTNHTFAGYWTALTDGNMVINANGVVQSHVAGWTGANRVFTRTTNGTLFARWTPANASIRAIPGYRNFGSHPLGYDGLQEQPITIFNNGEIPVTLDNLPSIDGWVLRPGAQWNNAIAPGFSRTFYARPENALPIGNYDRVVRIEGTDNARILVPLMFSVHAIPVVTVNYDIRSNTSAILSTAQNNVYVVKPAFRSTFAINLTRGHNILDTNLSQEAGCERAIHLGCCIECYPNLNRCYYEHHRSANRLVRVNLGTPERNVFKFVDFGLCSWQGGTTGHRGDDLAAVADAIGGNTILVSHSNSMHQNGVEAFRGAIAHEISHLLGADDFVCVPNQPCVMTHWNSLYNQWCDNCRRDIFNYRNSPPS